MYEFAIVENLASNSPKNVLNQKLPSIDLENITSSLVSLRSVIVCFMYHVITLIFHL